MTFLELESAQVAVNVRSEEESVEFVRYAVENGFAKNSWSETCTHYDYYMDAMCYIIERSGYMFYCNIDYYLGNGYKIVTIDEIDEFSRCEEAPIIPGDINDLLM